MRSPNLMNENPGEIEKIINGVLYRKGDKVQLKLGHRRADASDIFLNGKTATIEVIHTDYEDKDYIAVTMDDDPGQDLMRDMRMFLFFNPDEVEHI